VTPAERIILALDVPTAEEAVTWARRLRGRVGLFKIGLELFTAEGPAIVSRIAAEDRPVFLDLKLHDIPSTVAGAVRSACRLGVSMLTVHASGGIAMLRAACEAANQGASRASRSGTSSGPGVPSGSAAPSGPAGSSASANSSAPAATSSAEGRPAASGGLSRPRILAVTVLTSLGPDDLAAGGIIRTPERQVLALAETAWIAGCDGVVASPREVRALRAELGPGATIVTPGIRSPGDGTGDQTRTATPREALEAGSDYLVIGRPILSAPDPESALDRIIASLL